MVRLRIGIAYSIIDPAGRGIAGKISERLGLRCSDSGSSRASIVCDDPMRVIGFIDDVLYLEYLDDYFPNHDAVIILSRHKAVSGIPSLTVHYTGNPGDSALYGGRPRKLANTMPSLGSSLLYSINMLASSSSIAGKFSVTYEATHHGPTDNRLPVVFAEIGSSEVEWISPEAQDIWARAIIETVSRRLDCSEIAVGLGGNHYPAIFTQLTTRERICFGHIIPRYVLKDLGDYDTTRIVEQAIRSSVERIEKIYIEEKATQSKKIRHIKDMASRMGIEVEIL